MGLQAVFISISCVTKHPKQHLFSLGCWRSVGGSSDLSWRVFVVNCWHCWGVVVQGDPCRPFHLCSMWSLLQQACLGLSICQQLGFKRASKLCKVPESQTGISTWSHMVHSIGKRSHMACQNSRGGNGEKMLQHHSVTI